MNNPVSVKEKKYFIYWFLNQYQMKRIESNWILTYLANHHELLEHIHFVRDAKYCPRGLIISSNCSNNVPFRFYRDHIVTTDAEKAFHDIRLNPFEPLYIQLFFIDWKKSPHYARVLEENPFLSDDFYITKSDKEQSESIINYSLEIYKRNTILQQIDKALDNRDQKTFLKLSKEIHEIDKRLNNQLI